MGGLAKAAAFLSAGLAALCFAGGAAFALDVGAKATMTADGVAVSVWAVDPPTATVLSNITDGMRAEVKFRIEVYRASHGLFRLFGDRLVQDISHSREASWNLYQQSYLVTDSDGTEVSVESRDELERALFRLDHYVIPWRQFGETIHSRADLLSLAPDGAYLLVRVQVRPMKLVPALAILSFLRMEDDTVSGWTRLDVPK